MRIFFLFVIGVPCLLICFNGSVRAEALPLLSGGDPFNTLQQLTTAAEAATTAEARERLSLQAALLARILGERAAAERYLKSPTTHELTLLKFFDEDRGAPPTLPYTARYDGISRRVLEQWLGKSLSCWNNVVDPLLCPGIR